MVVIFFRKKKGKKRKIKEKKGGKFSDGKFSPENFPPLTTLVKPIDGYSDFSTLPLLPGALPYIAYSLQNIFLLKWLKWKFI